MGLPVASRLDPHARIGIRLRQTVPSAARAADPSRLLRGAQPILGLTIALLGPSVWSPPVSAPGAASFTGSRAALDRSLALARPHRAEMTAPTKRVASDESPASWRAGNASAAGGAHGARRLGPWPPSLRGYAIFYRGGDLEASVPRPRHGAPVITWPPTERATTLEFDHER